MPLAAGSAYVGYWVDYSKGYVLGATLTIPSRYAAILLAAMVMLVDATGLACWELVCFIVHHIQSTSHDKDGFFHQQQVLLRNGKPAFDIFLRMVELSFAWRKNTRKSFLRASPLIFIAILNIALFIVGGLFVTKIATPNSEVRARGTCGFIKGTVGDGLWVTGNLDDKDNGDVLYQSAYTSYREANNYARSCYGTQVDQSTTFCNIYTSPFIPSVRDDNAPCPFAEKACLAGAISFDTGLVSSEALGVNSRSSDRIQLRKKMTCAPIAIEQYTDGWTTEKKQGVENRLAFLPPGDNYRYYNFGPSLGSLPSDYTWVVSNETNSAQQEAYRLSSATFFAGNPNISDFQPLPDFDRTDADVTLLFKIGNVLYTQPVEDPWFKATTKLNQSIGINDVYVSEEPWAVMGCTEQYQFCNGEETCGPLGGQSDVLTNPPDIGYNALQLATWNLLRNYLGFMEIPSILQFLRKSDLLLAGMKLWGSVAVSSDLLADQWKHEMANLHNISLAGLQAHGVLHAAPGNTQIKPGVHLHDYIVPETTAENVKLCENQKFRSTKYTSISFLGLLLTLLICFSIILLNAFLPGLVKVLQGIWKEKGHVSKRAWIEDDVLQLQRLAMEARGVGPWNEKSKNGNAPFLESYALEFPRSFEGGLAEEVPLNGEGEIENRPWDTKMQSNVGYNPHVY